MEGQGWLKRMGEEYKRKQLVAPSAALSAAPKPLSAAPKDRSAAHLKHGRRLSKDTLDSILDYKQHYPTESNRAIAKKFDVNERTVRRLTSR